MLILLLCFIALILFLNYKLSLYKPKTINQSFEWNNRKCPFAKPIMDISPMGEAEEVGSGCSLVCMNPCSENICPLLKIKASR